FAMRRQLAGRRYLKCSQSVLVGRKPRHRRNPDTPAARGDIEIFPRRMRPRILDAAGQLDRTALPQLSGFEVDFEKREVRTDPGIEHRLLFGSLRERDARRRKSAGE